MKIVSYSIGNRREKWGIIAIVCYDICRKFFFFFLEEEKGKFFKKEVRIKLELGNK